MERNEPYIVDSSKPKYEKKTLQFKLEPPKEQKKNLSQSNRDRIFLEIFQVARIW